MYSSSPVTLLKKHQQQLAWSTFGALRRLYHALQDGQLRHTLQFGIGLHHAGLNEADRSLVEALFVGGKIQVPCASADALPAASSELTSVLLLHQGPACMCSHQPEAFIMKLVAPVQQEVCWTVSDRFHGEGTRSEFTPLLHQCDMPLTHYG